MTIPPTNASLDRTWGSGRRKGTRPPESRRFRPSGPPHFPDQEARAPAHLLVDAAHVFAHDPDPGQEDPHDDEGERDEREDALRLGASDEPAHEQEDAEPEAREGRDEPKEGEELQRHDGKTGHEVEVEA